MAVRAFLTSVPLEIFQTVKLSGGFVPSNQVLGKDYDWQEFRRVGIDTTWELLYKVFKKAGYPLAYALEGDYHPEGGLGHFSNTNDGTSYLAYVSPEVVEHVAKALAKFPIKQQLLEFEKDAQYLMYCLDYFSALVSFYQDATRKGEAIFISIN